MTAGLDYASGDAVILIDADLQDPPELILSMVDHCNKGIDVVYAKRVSRDADTALKAPVSGFFLQGV